MKTDFILNGEDATGNGHPQESLLDFLVREQGLFALHAPCQRGLCGRCNVTLDGRTVPACLTPVFMVKGREIVTPEGFKVTEDYKRILKVLEEEGLVQCNQCTAVQIFNFQTWLEFNPEPTEEDLRLHAAEIPCRCGTGESLVRGFKRLSGTKEAVRAHRR